jgi:beta-xylosidase
LRRHNGVFYLITAYINGETAPKFLLFNTTDPYSNNWSDPVIVDNPRSDIDPDLFWDYDGKLYVAAEAGIYISEVDILTGVASETWTVWNGTGERNPEGPHIMQKDGYYYLWIAEGGTENNHTVTIARATDIHDLFEGYSGNPILTAKGTDEYFQTVGHADLFQDADGNW